MAERRRRASEVTGITEQASLRKLVTEQGRIIVGDYARDGVDEMPQTDIHYWEADLYIHEGTYYLVGKGGAASPYAWERPGGSMPGNRVLVVSKAEAAEFAAGCARHGYLTDDEMIAEFGLTADQVFGEPT